MGLKKLSYSDGHPSDNRITGASPQSVPAYLGEMSLCFFSQEPLLYLQGVHTERDGRRGEFNYFILQLPRLQCQN